MKRMIVSVVLMTLLGTSPAMAEVTQTVNEATPNLLGADSSKAMLFGTWQCQMSTEFEEFFGDFIGVDAITDVTMRFDFDVFNYSLNMSPKESLDYKTPTYMEFGGVWQMVFLDKNSTQEAIVTKTDLLTTKVGRGDMQTKKIGGTHVEQMTIRTLTKRELVVDYKTIYGLPKGDFLLEFDKAFSCQKQP